MSRCLIDAEAYTEINSEDRLVQVTFVQQLGQMLSWESAYAWNHETFGPTGTPGPYE